MVKCLFYKVHDHSACICNNGLLFSFCQGGGDCDQYALCSVESVTVFVEYTTFLDNDDDKSSQ